MSLQLKSVYQEDVSVLANGTSLISVPCVVYSIVVSRDVAGDSVVSIANSSGNYSVSGRLEKVKITDECPTFQLTYPKGKSFSSGVAARANSASTNISVTYE